MNSPEQAPAQTSTCAAWRRPVQAGVVLLLVSCVALQRWHNASTVVSTTAAVRETTPPPTPFSQALVRRSSHPAAVAVSNISAAPFLPAIFNATAMQEMREWYTRLSGWTSIKRCAQMWLDVVAHRAEPFPPVDVFATDQEHHATWVGRGAVVCAGEPGRCQRRCKPWWWRSVSGRHNRTIRAPWVTYAEEAIVLAPAGDSHKLCSRGRTRCSVMTLAAGSFMSRHSPPSLLLKPLRELARVPKTRAVAFMYNNNSTATAQYRWAFRDVLRRFVDVSRPGGNDTTKTKHGRTVCQDDEAVHLYRPYAFVVAFENSDFDEYITEKIVNPFMAGAIPIYWGTDSVSKYFNPKAFLRRKDFPSHEALAQRVKELWENPELREPYLREPPCTEEGLQKLFWWRNRSLRVDWAGMTIPMLDNTSCDAFLD
eukprot:TRINITY_DN7277_c0_g1_i1.p1 TRINITY_DN7277_c0_g1~~TRINITY_DN7277_c0_g1_i1.p1  ORF type:complete len:476 (+),score=40.67 TRINITY_DN7277_c0_g1_i1:156-1430(+)